MVSENSTNSGKVDAILEALDRSDGSARPWHATARALQRLADHAREEEWNGDGQVRQLAERATKLSWGALARYLSAFNRIEAIATREGVAVEDLISDGFNSAEVAVRLYDRNREDGLTALRDLHHGRQTLAGVRRALEIAKGGQADGAVVAKSALLRKRKGEILGVEVALRDHGARLFGAGCKITRRPSLRYFKHIGVEARVAGKLVGGANILTPDPALKTDQIETMLPGALLLSNYFPRFFLIFSSGADPDAIDRTRAALKAFEAKHVSVATTVGESFQVEMEPVDRVPTAPGYEVLRDRLLAKR